MTRYPDDRRYSPEYSWILVEKDTATVGVLTEGSLKDTQFVFVKLPENGSHIKKGETFISLEAMKWSGHLASPVTGTIIAVNDALFAVPEQISKDPYGSWIMQVKLDDAAELEALLDANAARDHYAGDAV